MSGHAKAARGKGGPSRALDRVHANSLGGTRPLPPSAATWSEQRGGLWPRQSCVVHHARCVLDKVKANYAVGGRGGARHPPIAAESRAPRAHTHAGSGPLFPLPAAPFASLDMNDKGIGAEANRDVSL